MGKKILLEGKQIPINELPEGFYLVKLRRHSLYAGPRIKREEIMAFISERKWQELEVEVLSADFPYAHFYEPQSEKVKKIPIPSLPNTLLVGPGIPRVQRFNLGRYR